jgi:hypothetical protein
MDEQTWQLVKQWAYGPAIFAVGAAVTYFGPKLAALYWGWKGDSKKYREETAAKVVKDATDLFAQREAVLQSMITDANKAMAQMSMRLEAMQMNLDKVRDELTGEKSARQLAQQALEWLKKKGSELS